MLLNNNWVKEKIKGEIERCTEISENANTRYQNFRGAAKAAIREFMSL